MVGNGVLTEYIWIHSFVCMGCGSISVTCPTGFKGGLLLVGLAVGG